MKKDKITVADIAKKAGVSPATVSRVLRHRELVKSETIQQVENAMSALGCLLEKGTIAAATEQPLIILNVPELDNVFYLKVIDGALVSAKAHGYGLLINDSPLDRSSIQSVKTGTCRRSHFIESCLQGTAGYDPLCRTVSSMQRI